MSVNENADNEITLVEECIGKLAYFQRTERAIGRLTAALKECRHCVKRKDKPSSDGPFYVPAYCGHKVKTAYDQLEFLMSKMIAGEENEERHPPAGASGRKIEPLGMLYREMERLAASDLCCHAGGEEIRKEEKV